MHTHALAKSKIRFSQRNLPADATPGTVWAVAKLRAVSNQTQAELSFRGYHLPQQGHETERERERGRREREEGSNAHLRPLARELPVSICPMRQT